MNIAEAEAIVGGLSKPSKMPGYAYGIPARACITGAKLHPIKGSVCSDCYALKGRYAFPNVQSAQERRLKCMQDARWTSAMIYLIQKREIKWFRWHDSGDLQSVEHLQKINDIARACPETNFWLPTREKDIVRRFERSSQARFEPNLVVRISGTMIDGPAPIGFANTSTVVRSKAAATCPAYTQGGVCGDCRKCWDRSVTNVSYPRH